MDSAVELTAIFRVPLLWCSFFLFVGSGLLGLASPKVLQSINTAWRKPVEGPSEGILGKKIDADSFLLRHARVFSVLSLAAGTFLYYQIA